MRLIGSDGSTCRLETKPGLNYSKACFYSPGEETNKRGLAELDQLGAELWKIGNLAAISGKLH
jgi:hypothetical protein